MDCSALGVSTGLIHFWQPTPGLNNARMAGSTAQPIYEPPQSHLSYAQNKAAAQENILIF